MVGYNARHMRPKRDSEANAPTGDSHASRPHLLGKPSSLRLSWVLLGAVLLVSIAGGTLAWFGQTDGVTNIFTSGSVKPQIDETFDTGYTVKQDVKVQNTGTMPAYLRASVAVYWLDEDGNQLWDAPVLGNDYSIDWNVATSDTPDAPAAPDAPNAPDAAADGQWLQGDDGFYYWSMPVDKKQSTGVLITKASQIGGTPADGKRLVVDIASQALQAEGTAKNAFNEVWSKSSGLVAGEDGTLARQGA